MGTKQAKPITAAEAAALVQSGNRVDYGLGLGLPDAFERALAARAAELRGVRVRGGLATRPRLVAEGMASLAISKSTS